MLGKLGHEVVDAVDGEAAIEKYLLARDAGEPFDFVIMDLTIPGGMGGKEAVKRILDIDPSAKVIVASGYSNDPIIADYTSYGFAGCVSKPFRMKELTDALRKLSDAL